MFKKYKEQISHLQTELSIYRNNNAQLVSRQNELNLIISNLNEQIKSKDDEIKSLHYDYDDIILKKQQELKKLDGVLSDKKSSIEIYQLGYEDLEPSQYYNDKLKSVKDKIRKMLLDKSYYEVLDKWYVNGNVKEGNKLISFFTNITILSFNLMTNADMKSANVSNKKILENKFRRTFESYSDKLSGNGIKLNMEYLKLILTELDLRVKMYIAKENEKEEERRQREILKEQVKAEVEIKKNKEKLEKKMIYLRGQMDKGVDVKEEIQDVQKQLDDDEYMLINGRCGWCYIIGNPSFGKDVYKIGITRRTEFQKRIDELNSSNVCFQFRPSAIIWSDDVFKLESDLHKRFSEYRVNKIKTHREFFKIPLSDIERAIKEEFHLNVSFDYDIIDEDFLASGYLLTENFIKGE